MVTSSKPGNLGVEHGHAWPRSRKSTTRRGQVGRAECGWKSGRRRGRGGGCRLPSSARVWFRPEAASRRARFEENTDQVSLPDPARGLSPRGAGSWQLRYPGMLATLLSTKTGQPHGNATGGTDREFTGLVVRGNYSSRMLPGPGNDLAELWNTDTVKPYSKHARYPTRHLITPDFSRLVHRPEGKDDRARDTLGPARRGPNSGGSGEGTRRCARPGREHHRRGGGGRSMPGNPAVRRNAVTRSAANANYHDPSFMRMAG